MVLQPCPRAITIPIDLGYSTYIAYGDYILVSLSNSYNNFGPSLAVVKARWTGAIKNLWM